MWSGGISKRNPVRPAGKWARGLTCQTAKTPACHIQFVCAQHEHVHTYFKALNKFVKYKFFLVINISVHENIPESESLLCAGVTS